MLPELVFPSVMKKNVAFGDSARMDCERKDSLDAANDASSRYKYSFVDLREDFRAVFRHVDRGLEEIERVLGILSLMCELETRGNLHLLSKLDKELVVTGSSKQAKPIPVEDAQQPEAALEEKEAQPANVSELAGDWPLPQGAVDVPSSPILMRRAWGEMVEALAAVAKDKVRSAQAIETEVVESLQSFYSVASKESSDILGHYNKQLESVVKAQNVAQSSCQSTLKLVASWKAARSHHQRLKSSEQRPAKGAARGTWTDMATKFASRIVLKINDLADGSPKSILFKAWKNCLQYEHDVKEANRQYRYFCDDVTPELLERLERLDAKRVESLKANLAMLAVLKQQDSLFVSVNNSLAAVSVEQEKANFVRRRLRKLSLKRDSDIEQGGQEIVEGFPMRYGLPYTPDDVKVGRLGSFPFSPFNCSLEDVISRQLKSASPSISGDDAMLIQDTPRIVTSLAAVILARGLKCEGIFRLAGPSQEVQDLHTRFSTGLYSDLPEKFPSATTHATLLKKWLSQLPEPIFPFSLYPQISSFLQSQCPKLFQTVDMPSISREITSIPVASVAEVTVAASPKTPTIAGDQYQELSQDSNHTEPSDVSAQNFLLLSEEGRQQLEILIEQLSPLRKRVLATIADIVENVNKPSNRVKNRMTIKSLAVCLAPCLLRSPEDVYGNRAELAFRAKLNARFVCMVFTFFCQRRPEVSEKT